MPHRRRHDEDAPRPHRARHHKKKKKGPPPVLVGLAVVGGIVLLAGGGLAAVLLWDRGKGGPGPDPFPNMLAHWPLDEAPGERVPDKTGRGNDGRLVGGGFGPGVKGKAFYLDGRDDQYVDLSQVKDLNFAAGAEFTLAAWYQTGESHGTILAFRHRTGTCQCDLFVRTNHLLAVIGDDKDASGGSFVWCEAANDGKWHHAAVTRKGKTIELYYDGLSAGTETTALAAGPITTDQRAIGCNLRFVQDNEKQFGRRGFKGAIDEVYVFGRALSAGEIQALMKR